MFGQSRYEFAWIQQVSEVEKAEWDALAMPLATPFFEWDWLNDLEKSGSAVAQAGWMPCHLTVRREGNLIATAPMYLKGHSYGEFVFDQQFAELADRIGVNYYPKLLGMSPFTPAEGYRFLIAPSEDDAEMTAQMVRQIDRFCDRNSISSCHFLYTDPEWRATIEQCGFNKWLHHSFIWSNDEFADFSDYLKIFNANQRRNIKRERKAVTKAGLRLQVFAGDEIPDSFFSQMYRFYASTCDKFGWWGSKYLMPEFFERLQHSYRHRIVFVAAYNEGGSPERPLGMSFCLTKGDRLYGRYWGSDNDIDCLHFDACYYSPIEWGIDRGIKTFDPGAGGRHKKRRGFPATPNYSVHRFYARQLGKVIVPYLGQINEHEQMQIDAINAELPFAKENGSHTANQSTKKSAQKPASEPDSPVTAKAD
ncbi:MAG: GNAT family N-acetyltransferase [Geitlerinemataceae cyanobacterium]